MLMVWLVIWAICGVLGALIFQSKNREPWKGAILGFVLGVIGLLIAAVFSKRVPQEREWRPIHTARSMDAAEIGRYAGEAYYDEVAKEWRE